MPGALPYAELKTLGSGPGEKVPGKAETARRSPLLTASYQLALKVIRPAASWILKRKVSRTSGR